MTHRKRRNGRAAEMILSLWGCRMIRYVFFGGMTTFVTLFVYFILRMILFLPLSAANVISVASAVLFAYLVNARFVFESRPAAWPDRGKQFAGFVSARLFTMALEVGGVWLLAEAWKMDDMISKIVIQFVVLILNYVFSRFLIFVRRDEADHRVGRK